MHELIALAAAAAGLVITFAGYPLIRLLIGLLGLLAGAFAGSVAAGLLFAPAETWVYPVSMVVGGLLGALLAQFFFSAGIFLLGACFGALVGSVLAARFGFEPVVGGVVAALAGGLLALGLQKPLIALSTAFLGSWLLVSSAFVALGIEEALRPPNEMLERVAREGQTGFLAAWAALGAIGFAVQIRSRPRSQTPERRQSGR
jgi:hypothetical protein